MDPTSPFAGATDVTPYVTAAYALGALLLGGMAVWTLVARARLQERVAAARPQEGKHGG